MGRVRYIDMLKGLAIIFIINVHIPIDFRPFVNGVTFHVPSFFAVVGLIYAYKGDIRELNLKQIAKKRFLQVLKPYFVISAIWVTVNTIYLYVHNYNISYILLEEIGNIYKTVSFTGIGVLWFLPTLFFAEILFIYYMKRIRRNHLFHFFVLVITTGILISVLFGIKIIGRLHTDVLSHHINLFNNELIVVMQTLTAVVFMFFGYLIGNKLEHLVNSPVKLFCLTIVGFTANYMISYNRSNDLHYVNINHAVIYFITSFIGIVSLILLALLLSRYKTAAACLSWLGRHTLIIMTTHNECGFISLSLFLLNKFNFAGNIFFVKLSILVFVLIIEYFVGLLADNTCLKNIFYPKEGAHENEKFNL